MSYTLEESLVCRGGDIPWWVGPGGPPCDLAVSYRLDLDAWINEPPSDSESEEEPPRAMFQDEEQRQARQRPPEVDEEELARVSMPSILMARVSSPPFSWLNHSGELTMPFPIAPRGP